MTNDSPIGKIGSQQDNICPVCQDWKLTNERYCQGCQDWKEKADERRKADARRKSFGGFL